MRIILIEPSAIVRAIFEQNIKNYPNIEIVASVSTGIRALQYLKQNVPDVIISDCDAGKIEGKDALDVFSSEMHIFVIALKSQKITADEYAKSSSILYMEKPKLNSYTQDFFDSLVKNLNKSTITVNVSSNKDSDYKILCIGASTGGPRAVSEVLSGLGNNFPIPILYAQHIEVGNDLALANWLSDVCSNIKIKLAENGEVAEPGIVYMAPADVHLEIDYVNKDGLPVLKLSDEDPERFLRPAVNKLFRSAACKYKQNCLAVLLTGMGQDGADGCCKICDAGGWTIVEDRSTCAVFGMPAAAIELGGAKEVLPRGEIIKQIVKLVKK